ncbi:MAG: hypothetical protein GQ467_03090 [Mariprofundaceae bacterium]|nr:hypothetical protein [Mariprofundaceae bacterium]
MGSTSLLPHGSVASTLESSPYSEYACGSSRLAPRSAAKLKRSLKNRIKWPELRFPPINLWVMASLPGSKPSKAFHLDMATHTHRRQRPGLSAKRPNALNKLHRRLESLLAVRGGKL